MSYNLYLLKSSGRLNPFADQIQVEFDSFNRKIKNIFPPQDVDMVVYDNPFGAIPEQGIGGFTPYSYLIFISVDPDFPNFKKTLNEQFSRTLAHEMYHAIRGKNFGYGNTLLEALISEGLADHFDLEINKTSPQIWDTALTTNQLEKMKILARKEYDNQNYNRNDWFFGGQNIPKWAGYTLGFDLVENFLKKHPDKKPSTLFKVKSEEFIKD